MKRVLTATLVLALAVSLCSVGAFAGTIAVGDNAGFFNLGTITNDGTFTCGATGTVANNGTFVNEANGTIQNSGTFTNNGTYENAGTVTNTGTMLNTNPDCVSNDLTRAYNITFYSVYDEANPNSNISEVLTVAEGGTVTPPSPVSRPGYSFTGWYKTATPTEDDTPINSDNFGEVTSNMILYAVWEEAPSSPCTVKIPSALTTTNAKHFTIVDFKVNNEAVDPSESNDTVMTYSAKTGEIFSFTLNAADGYAFTAPPVLSVNSGNVTLNATNNAAPYQYSIKLAGNYDLTDLTLEDTSVLTPYGVNVSIRNNEDSTVTSGLCVEIVGDPNQYYDLYLCDANDKQILYYGNMPGRSVCNNWRVTEAGTATTAKLFLHDNTTTEVWSGTIPSITTVISQDRSPLAAGADAPSGSATKYNSENGEYTEYTYTFTGLDFATYTYRIEKTGSSAYLLSGSSYTTTDRLDSSGGTTYTLVATKSEGNATNGFTLTQYASVEIAIENNLNTSAP